MSIDAIHRSRRYEAPELNEDHGRSHAVQSPKREALHLEHPIHYPKEMFAGSAFEKKSGEFPRAALGDHAKHSEASEYGRMLRADRPRPADAPSAKAASGPTAGRIFTGNANEVATRTTRPTPREVVAMVKAKWPELTEQGARTLAAQFMAETGDRRQLFLQTGDNYFCRRPPGSSLARVVVVHLG